MLFWIKFTLRYVRYLLHSQTRHDIHSPFVFSFVEDVINDDTPYYAYDQIEKIRKGLLNNHKEIIVRDFGAGSKVSANAKRKISKITRYSAKKKKYAQLIFRIVNYFKPQNIVELGTSLGITTMYLAAPNNKTPVFTLEGCPNISELARKNFKSLHLDNIVLTTGNFENTYSKILDRQKQVDFIFFDGNHQQKPTLNYFEQALPYCSENAILIFDDIHWTEEMEEAWKKIKEHEAVSLTIDLFSMGIVFLKPQLVKQHFIIKF